MGLYMKYFPMGTRSALTFKYAANLCMKPANVQYCHVSLLNFQDGIYKPFLRLIRSIDGLFFILFF